MDDANSSGGKKETKRGRAAFVPSEEQRAIVRRMASDRLGHPVIAAEIGISVPTLRKAFAEELKDRLAGGNLFAAAAEEIPAPQPAPLSLLESAAQSAAAIRARAARRLEEQAA